MDDVRCPMCGKPNPPELEVCRFCEARLKPLIASPSSDEEGPGAPDPGDISQASPEAGSSIPDWLSGLRDEDAGDQTATSKPGAGDEAPGYWSLEEQDSLDSPVFPSSEGEMEPGQDWLSRLDSGQEQVEEQAGEQDSGETGPVEKTAAFLNPEEIIGEGELPDWVSEYKPDSPGQDEPPGVTPAGGAEDSSPEEPEQVERPHWLDRIRQHKQEGDTAEEAPAALTQGDETSSIPGPSEPEAEEVPDWLSDTRLEDEETSPVGSAETPAWLAEPEQTGQEQSPQSGHDLPEWLKESPAEPPSETSEPRQELPDWLAGAGDLQQSGLPEPVDADPGASSGEEEGSLPDWLARLGASVGDQSSGGGTPALILDDEVEEPTGIEARPASQDEDLEEYHEDAALPDWLSQIQPGVEQPDREPFVEEGEEAGLAPAQLPSWLEAMRPVEMAAPATPVSAEQDTRVEKAGPLAGLPGVLPAEPEFGQISKPKSSLIKLQVSDSQQAHVTLLENLLAEEGQAKAVPARPAITSQYLLRLFIALALFLAVLAPLWLNRQALPLTTRAGIPAEILSTGRAIDALPSGAPILVAFDYEPGLSGEMDAAAAAVVAEVIGQGAYLTLVSTNPTGPVMAERFLKARQSVTEAGYANLGYIPGGPAGLIAFAASPRQVIPFDLSGKRIWEAAPLAAVNGLPDFEMVLVLTENPDTARNWIEQAQPFLQPQNRPMVMVVSAQAEPMVRPYYETSPRQVEGMVAGLAGGAAFESLSGNMNLSRQYWDSFGGGLLVASALILIGGIVNLILVLLPQSKKNRVEGAL